MEIPQLPDGDRAKADFPGRHLGHEKGAVWMEVVNRIAQSELFLIWLWAVAERRRVYVMRHPANYKPYQVEECINTYRLVRDGGMTYEWWCEQAGTRPSGIYGEILHEYRTFILGLETGWAAKYGVGAMTDEEFFYWKCSFWRDQEDLDWLGLTSEEAQALLNPQREL